MILLTKHPVIAFGLGIATGFLLHKYRKEIIETATGVTEKGKEFVLHKKESLEDVFSVTKEPGESTN